MTVLARTSSNFQKLRRRNAPASRGGVTSSSQIPSLVEEDAPLQNMQKSWKEQKYGHRSRREPKPRLTILAWVSSNLPD
jgi:hypothetical protein